MTGKRREKKSETLEVRLPYSQKKAFMRACRARGMTASDVVREYVADYIQDANAQPAAEPRQTWRRPQHVAAGMSGAMALLLGVAPAVAEDGTASDEVVASASEAEPQTDKASDDGKTALPPMLFVRAEDDQVMMSLDGASAQPLTSAPAALTVDGEAARVSIHRDDVDGENVQTIVVRIERSTDNALINE